MIQNTIIGLVKRSKYDDTNNVYNRYSLIKEDIEKYFDGKHSLDETVNIINDRMTKYVNERRQNRYNYIMDRVCVNSTLDVN